MFVYWEGVLESFRRTTCKFRLNLVGESHQFTCNCIFEKVLHTFVLNIVFHQCCEDTCEVEKYIVMYFVLTTDNFLGG